MADDDIKQRVIIEGDQALNELNKLGDQGAAALDRIRKAGDGDFGSGLSKLAPTLQKVQGAFASVEESASRVAPAIKKTQAELRALAQASAGTSKVRDDLNETAAATAGLDINARQLSRTFRALGRVTNIPALTFLGREFRAVAQAGALIAGPAIIGGLALIADSAAKATQPFQDLAFAAGAAPDQLQRASTAALAFGGDVQKLGAALSKIPQQFQATEKGERDLKSATDAVRSTIDKGTDTLARHGEQVRQAAQSYETFRLQIALGLDPVSGLHEQLDQLNQAYTDGKIAKDQYDKQTAKLNNQLLLAQRQQRIEQAALEKQIRDANQSLADQAEAQLQAEKAAIAAKKSVEESANAYVKLGISSAQLKALKPEQAFELIASKLEPMEKGFKRNQLAIEIFGEDARRFINELDKGAGSVKKFVDESARIAPAFTVAQNAIGDKFLTSLNQLTASIGALKDSFGLAVAPAFITFFNDLRDIFISIRPALTEFATAIGPVVGVALKGLTIVLQAIIQVLSAVYTNFKLLADLLNAGFGTNAITGMKLILGVLGALLLAFFPITAAVIAVVAAIGLLGPEFGAAFDIVKSKAVGFWSFLVGLWTKGVATLSASWQSIVDTFHSVFDPIAQFFVDLWAGIVATFNTGVQFVKDAFTGALTFITGLWETFKSYLQSWVTAVKQFFQPLIDLIKKIGAFFSSGTADAGTAQAGAGAFAAGGHVRGPGTGTSDSIAAWLSNNEFVMKARAVAKYGLGFMNAINEGKLSLSELASLSVGSMFDSLAPMLPVNRTPAFAEGGHVNIPGMGLKPVAINFEGTKFDAFMTDSAVSQLSKKSVQARARRAGRAPSWVGK